MKRYRGNPANDDVVGDADGVIRTALAFWATVGNASILHGVDRQHLAETLRRAGRPGEGVTAELIYRTAAALRRAV